MHADIIQDNNLTQINRSPSAVIKEHTTTLFARLTTASTLSSVS